MLASLMKVYVTTARNDFSTFKININNILNMFVISLPMVVVNRNIIYREIN